MIGAASPEELDRLLEDGLLDGSGVAALFAPQGVVVSAAGVHPASHLPQCLESYVAEGLVVPLGRDLALVIGPRSWLVCSRVASIGWQISAVVVAGT